MEANNTNPKQHPDYLEAVRVFDELIADATDPAVKADRELMKAYFTDKGFRKFMEGRTAQLNGVA